MAGDTDRVFVKWNHKRKDSPGWVVQDDCHIWTGTRTNFGYGMAWDTQQRRVRLVHRIRYEREIGPIPEGMQLDHFVCENRACCNPAHVRPVTPRENSLRSNSPASSAASRTHCPQGHALSPDRKDGRDCLICRRTRSAANARRYRGRKRDDYQRSEP